MSKVQNTQWALATVQYVKLPRDYDKDGKDRPILSFNQGAPQGMDRDVFNMHENAFDQMRGESKTAVFEMFEAIKNSEKDPGKNGKRSMKIQARDAFAHGYGNCTEQAAIAFRYLKKTCNASRLDVMLAEYTNGFMPDKHVFVVIGRIDGSASRELGSWGDEAVVCDPWAPDNYQVYDAGEIPTRLKHVLGNFTLAGSVARIAGDGTSAW